MCLYPKLIKNRKYTANKKNGGKIPAVSDERTLWVPVGCGNCMECRKQKARDWQVRLLEDIRHNKNGIFVTLTFDNENYTKLYNEIKNEINNNDTYLIDNTIAKLGTRRFLERWRKEHKKSVRHWLITELGHNGTENIHIHGIIWTDKKGEEIEKHWQYGYVWRGNKKGGITENYVNEKTINYIIKYVHKTDENHQYYKPIILTSPGIGKGYFTREDSQLNQFNNEKTREFYRTRTGHKLNLPIYYRNLIFTEEEREKLWLQKLDKQERWIMGEKIDVSSEEGETIYMKTLQYYQEKNRRLGFGNDEIDWNKKEYEEKKRILKQAERLGLTEEEINKRIKNFENYRRTKEKTRTHENIRARADIISRMEQ